MGLHGSPWEGGEDMQGNRILFHEFLTWINRKKFAFSYKPLPEQLASPQPHHKQRAGADPLRCREGKCIVFTMFWEPGETLSTLERVNSPPVV